MNWNDPGWKEAARDYHAERERNGGRQPTGGSMKADARRFTLFAELEINSTKEWLVHHLLGDGDASVLFGKPGDGKSVLAEDLALHIAAGRPWHGRRVKQGAVVFVALERRKLVERRAIAFRRKYGLTELPWAIIGGVHDFRNPKTVTQVAEIVREVEAATGQQGRGSGCAADPVAIAQHRGPVLMQNLKFCMKILTLVFQWRIYSNHALKRKVGS
jgi:hypothetical protein